MSKSGLEIKVRNARSKYFQDTREVQILTPSDPVHKSIITWLREQFTNYSFRINHNDRYVGMDPYENGCLPEAPDKEIEPDQVPDLMGIIASYDLHNCGVDPLVRWIVEVRCGQDRKATMRKLRLMTEINPNITLALMIVLIDENDMFYPPDESSDVVTELRSSAQMDFKTFISQAATNQPEGTSNSFQFDSKDQGTLIANIQMDGIEHMLHKSKRQKVKVDMIEIIEELNLEWSALDDARNSKPKLRLNWIAAANISHVIYETAYVRYQDWFNHRYYTKRKAGAAEVSSGTPSPQTPESSMSGAREPKSKRQKVSEDWGFGEKRTQIHQSKTWRKK
ncbi:hypothetical protein DFH29DRAFT_878723 [Suillus ampliporus]|nr:hypothetical protein DFH29DRAFT_878723 [Suillus ampliporus]